MKILLFTALLALAGGNAFAYSTNAVTDPVNGNVDRMVKMYKKSAAAGFSDAITAAGEILSYGIQTGENDGYTLTRVGSNTSLGSNQQACIAMDTVATGDTAMHRCINKGFVDFLKYDTTGGVAIVAGDKLCVNSVGAAVDCAACSVAAGSGSSNNNCNKGSATQNSKIISIQNISAGTTGNNLKAIILEQ